jgi:hypothetical protein
MKRFFILTILSLLSLSVVAEDNFDETVSEAVNNAQPVDHTVNNNPQEDLKKIEEEFDLGEPTNEDTSNNKVNINQQPSLNNNVQTNPTIINEDDLDLEDVISANYYSKATVLVTNKITAKSQLLTIKVGASTFFGNIEIFPVKCWKSPNKYNPESKAFLNIIERKIDDESKNIFKGWIFSSSISLSTMEHPIYEISITDCTGDKITN